MQSFPELRKVVVELPQIRWAMASIEASSKINYEDRWTKVKPEHLDKLPLSEG